MEKRDIKDWKIAVLGAGTMGYSVAQLFAAYGHEVNLYNRTPANLDKAFKHIKTNFQTLADLNSMKAEDVPAAYGRIRGFTDIKSAVEDVDYVIENVAESIEVKKEIFAQVDKCCKSDVIFASNTSTMYDIFKHLDISHPERMIITHFFNPAYVLLLVELVRGPETSDEVIERMKNFLEHCGREVAVVKKAVPGFILNRISLAVFREATYIISQGWAEPEDVDKAITAIYGPRYTFEGPFGLCDFAGIDIYERLSDLLFPVLGDSKKCPPIIKEMIADGKLGVKASEGFYKYEDREDANRKRDLKILKTIQAIKAVDKEVNGMME